MKTIAILGDSSSSSLGGHNITYPHLLYGLLQPQGYKFYNYAVPGSTSADAKAIYHNLLKREKYDYLIIYLGNNEACFSTRKGYMWNWYWKVLARLRKTSISKMHKFYNKFYAKYHFTYAYDSDSLANTAGEFAKNVKSIVRSAKKNGTQVIVISPVANERYLSGSGLPNYLFFKLIHIDDEVSENLKSCDAVSEDLVKGIKFQEQGNYSEMIVCYESIIATNDDELLTLIAINNLAVYYFRLDGSRCKRMLLEAINTHKNYNAIIYYNLYLCESYNNNNREADQYLKKSYSDDYSLYRVKNEYREKLREISLEYNVSLLDMGTLVNSNDFIDYCHPTKAGHQKIADKLHAIINAGGNASPVHLSIEKRDFISKLLSPDYFFHPKENYVDYYYIDDFISDISIQKSITALMRKYTMEDVYASPLLTKDVSNHLTRCLTNFIASNYKHPIFNNELDITNKLIPYSHEILVTPENYLSRLLYNYYLLFEEKTLSSMKNIEGFDKKYIERSSFYAKIILRNNEKSLETKINLSLSYYKAIYKKLLDLLACSNIFSNIIHKRKREIIFWYTREAFRYGTHSRLSMLYDRLTIDHCIESIVVLLVISFANNFNSFDKLIHLLRSMQVLIDIHEDHTGRHHINPHYELASYEAELSHFKKRMLQSLEDNVSDTAPV